MRRRALSARESASCFVAATTARADDEGKMAT